MIFKRIITLLVTVLSVTFLYAANSLATGCTATSQCSNSLYCVVGGSCQALPDYTSEITIGTPAGTTTGTTAISAQTTGNPSGVAMVVSMDDPYPNSAGTVLCAGQGASCSTGANPFTFSSNQNGTHHVYYTDFVSDISGTLLAAGQSEQDLSISGAGPLTLAVNSTGSKDGNNMSGPTFPTGDATIIPYVVLNKAPSDGCTIAHQGNVHTAVASGFDYYTELGSLSAGTYTDTYSCSDDNPTQTLTGSITYTLAQKLASVSLTNMPTTMTAGSPALTFTFSALDTTGAPMTIPSAQIAWVVGPENPTPSTANCGTITAGTYTPPASTSSNLTCQVALAVEDPNFLTAPAQTAQQTFTVTTGCTATSQCSNSLYCVVGGSCQALPDYTSEITIGTPAGTTTGTTAISAQTTGNPSGVAMVVSMDDPYPNSAGTVLCAGQGASCSTGANPFTFSSNQNGTHHVYYTDFVSDISGTLLAAGQSEQDLSISGAGPLTLAVNSTGSKDGNNMSGPTFPTGDATIIPYVVLNKAPSDGCTIAHQGNVHTAVASGFDYYTELGSLSAGTYTDTYSCSDDNPTQTLTGSITYTLAQKLASVSLTNMPTTMTAGSPALTFTFSALDTTGAPMTIPSAQIAWVVGPENPTPSTANCGTITAGTYTPPASTSSNLTCQVALAVEDPNFLTAPAQTAQQTFTVTTGCTATSQCSNSLYCVVGGSCQALPDYTSEITIGTPAGTTTGTTAISAQTTGNPSGVAMVVSMDDPYPNSAGTVLCAGQGASCSTGANPFTFSSNQNGTHHVYYTDFVSDISGTLLAAGQSEQDLSISGAGPLTLAVNSTGSKDGNNMSGPTFPTGDATIIPYVVLNKAPSDGCTIAHQGNVHTAVASGFDYYTELGSLSAGTYTDTYSCSDDNPTQTLTGSITYTLAQKLASVSLTNMPTTMTAGSPALTFTFSALDTTGAPMTIPSAQIAWVVGPENPTPSTANCGTITAGTYTPPASTSSNLTCQVALAVEDPNFLTAPAQTAQQTFTVTTSGSSTGSCNHTTPDCGSDYCGQDKQCHPLPSVVAATSTPNVPVAVGQTVNFSGYAAGAEPLRTGLVISLQNSAGIFAVCSGQSITCNTLNAGANPGPYTTTAADVGNDQITAQAFTLDIDNISQAGSNFFGQYLVVNPPLKSVSITNVPANIAAGSPSTQLTISAINTSGATVSIPSSDIAWTVAPISPSISCGVIDVFGNYTAPATVTTPQNCEVTAIVDNTYTDTKPFNVIQPVPPPAATLSASPTSIPYPGESVQLVWTSTNSTAVTILPTLPTACAVIPNVAGSCNVEPLSTITYTITATGVFGTATQQATITVTPWAPGSLHVAIFSGPANTPAPFYVPNNTPASFNAIEFNSQNNPIPTQPTFSWSVRDFAAFPPTGCKLTSAPSATPATITASCPGECILSAQSDIIYEGSYLSGGDSIDITGTPLTISLNHLPMVIAPGSGQQLIATANGTCPLMPSDLTFTVQAGSCVLAPEIFWNDLPSGGSLHASDAVSVPPGATGTCTIDVASALLGYNQIVPVTISNAVTVSAIVISTTGPVNLVPGQDDNLDVQVLDQSGNALDILPQITVGPTTTCALQWFNLPTPTDTTMFDANIQAQQSTGTCIVTVSTWTVSASYTFSISTNVVNMQTPIGNQPQYIANDSAIVVISGYVAGASQVTLLGTVTPPSQATFNTTVVSAQAVVGAPPNSLAWSYNWNEAEGLNSGAVTITATSSGAQPQNDIFYVFKYPPPPVLTAEYPKIYTGDSNVITATAQDDPGNPTTDPYYIPGVHNVELFDPAGANVGNMSPISSTGNTFSVATPAATSRGTQTYSALTVNNVFLPSVQKGTVSFQVLQRPSVAISCPGSGGPTPPVFSPDPTLGAAKVPITITLTDPDSQATSVELIANGIKQATLSLSGTTTLNVFVNLTAQEGGYNPANNLVAIVYYRDIENPTSLNPLSQPSSQLTINVVNPPQATPASASPNPVIGSTTTLLTTGATSLFGPSALTYQWSSALGNPGKVTFDFGGANPTTNASFTSAGSYVLNATITDPIGGSVQTSTTVVVVAGLQVLPSSAYALTGGTIPFSSDGKDQFGHTVSMQGALWSTSCPATIGTINAQTGFFSAIGVGGPCAVTVSASGVQGSAQVSVVQDIPPTVQITSVNPSNSDYVSPMTITLTATTTDTDNQIQQVQFYASGVPIGAAITQAPYTLSWANMLPGDYYVTAVATDLNGVSSTSSAIPVSVKEPVLAILKVTPSTTTTQNNGPTAPFNFTVEGTGFSPNGLLPGSQVTWNGQPVLTTFQSGNILDALLAVQLQNWELLNPQTAEVQVVNSTASMSVPFPFIVDGLPIIQCLNVGTQNSCPNGTNVNHAASSLSVGIPATSLQVTQNDAITAVTEFTKGGIQWVLYSGLLTGLPTSQTPVYSSGFQLSPTFELTQHPSLLAGEYTLVATGMNLAGVTSAPATISFTLLASNLSTTRVYPDPWRSDQDAAFPLKFDQITPGATVKIFTVSGHWVQSITADSSGLATWDLKNSSGERVQSGLYLYLVTDSQGNKATGKFAIIR